MHSNEATGRSTGKILEVTVPGRYAEIDGSPGLFRDLRSGTLLRAEVPDDWWRFRALAAGGLLLGRHRRILGYEAVLRSDEGVVALRPDLVTETVQSRAAWLGEGEPRSRLVRLLIVCVQIAEALVYAHERSVVHLDLDLAAVRFLGSGDVVVEGFGVPEHGVAWRGVFPSPIHDWHRFAMLLRELFALAGEPVPGAVEEEVGLLLDTVGRDDLPFPGAPGARILKQLRRLSNPRSFGPRPVACDWSADEYARIAGGLLALGAVAEAAKHLESALERDPAHPEALHYRGMAAWWAGEAGDRALRFDLENAAQSHDVAHRASLLLGHLHVERGDAEAAVACLTAAAEDEGLRPEAEALLKTARGGLCLWGGLLETLGRHQAHVTDASFLPDGRHALSTGNDGVLRLWDLEDRRCLHELDDHAKGINCLAVSEDGALALTGSDDPRCTLETELTPGGGIRISEYRDEGAPADQLRLWDLKAGTCARILDGPAEGITAVALSPDGTAALSGSKDGIVRSWDLTSDGPGRILTEVGKRVGFVGFVSGGELALIVDEGGEITVLDHERGSSVAKRRLHRFGPKGCVLTAEGNALLVGLYEGVIKVVDPRIGAIRHEIRTGFRGLETFAAFTDGQRLLVGGQGMRVIVVDVQSGRTLRTFEGHESGIRAAAVHPSGGYALTGGLCGEVKLWSLAGIGERRGALVPVTPVGPGEDVEDENDLERAALEARMSIHAGRMAGVDAALSRVRRYPGRVRLPCMQEFVSALSRGGRRTGIRNLWIKSRRTTSDPVLRAVSSDGRLAVTAPFGGSLGCVVGLGEDPWEIPIGLHKNDVNGACFTPDGRRLLTASRDYSVIVWGLVDSPDGRRPGRLVPTQTLNGHMHWVDHVRVSPDGRRAISSAYHERIRYWDLDRGREVCSLEGPMEFTHALAMAPDGRWAASGHHEGEIRIWNLVQGRQARVLGTHAGRLEEICITADGHRLVSVSGDSTLKVWDMAMCRCVLTTTVPAENLGSLALTPDGRYALAGSRGGVARLFDLVSGEVVRELKFDGLVSPIAYADERGTLYLGIGKEILTLGLDCTWEFPEGPPDAEELAPFCWTYLSACSRQGEDPASSTAFEAWFERVQCAGLGPLDRKSVEAEVRRLATNGEPPPPLPAGLRPSEQIPFPVDHLLEVLERIGGFEEPVEWARRLDRELARFEPLEARRFALRARLLAIVEFLREYRLQLENRDLLLAHPDGRYVGVRRSLLTELCRARFDRVHECRQAGKTHFAALFNDREIRASKDSEWCTLWVGGLGG